VILVGITIRDDNNFDELRRNLEKINNSQIKVGFFGELDSDMITIARVHEFGAEIKVTDKMRGWFAANGFPLKKETTKIVIPERSFLRSGFDENVGDINKKIRNLLPDVLEDTVDPDEFMNMIGLEFAGLIQKKLRNLKTPANSSMTTERKGSTNPLIDDGRLVGSIRHKVD
jgi:hypothetical protein